MKTIISLCVSLTMVLGLSGCVSADLDSQGDGWRLVMAAAGSCDGVAHGNDDFKLPPGATHIVVRVFNADTSCASA